MKRISEASRSQLIKQSKAGSTYVGQQNTNRWTAKNKVSVAATTKDYNRINMNSFWKDDILKFDIPVAGETDTYYVTVEITDVLSKLEDAVARANNKLDARTVVYPALTRALNDSQNVKIFCTCPDFTYRFQYWATKKDYNAGKSQTKKADITNPDDKLGAACKHVLCAVNNLEWLSKIASVIVNYVNYCKDNLEYNYSRFIFPKLYGMSYQEAIQLSINDVDKDGELKNDLDTSEEIINLSNAIGKSRGKFKKGSNKDKD